MLEFFFFFFFFFLIFHLYPENSEMNFSITEFGQIHFFPQGMLNSAGPDYTAPYDQSGLGLLPHTLPSE